MSAQSPHLTQDKIYRAGMMTVASSSMTQHTPAPGMNPYDAAALRPAPSAGVFQKLGFGKKSAAVPKTGSMEARGRLPYATLLHAVAGDDQIRLPLAEALAISPEDETLLAIKRAHAAAAANAQGRSRTRLAHKFSSAALDQAAGNSEPTVVGIWTGRDPQWIGEHRPAAHDIATAGNPPVSPRGKNARPRIAIPHNTRASVSPEHISRSHSPNAAPHGSRPEFAEFGYVSPVSSSPRTSLAHSSSFLWGDSQEVLSPPSDNEDSARPNHSTYHRSTYSASEDGSSSPSSQEVNTPPPVYGWAVTRDSLAWSVRDPCAAGVFEEEDCSLERHPSLMPLGLSLRPARSATVLQRSETRNYSRPRTAPTEDALAAREDANRKRMTALIARLKEAGVQQAKLDALIGLEQASDGSIPAQSANSVVVNILKQSSSMKDLFSMAVVNKGFYAAFKSQELALMKNALRNQSPAAWEYRQIALESLPFAEYTPSQYLAFHTRDVYVLAALKEMLCSGQHLARDKLRPLTLQALKSRFSPRAVDIDDAFWRIWTFCELFGPEKGEEEDITAQMDWLRGGAEVQAGRRMAEAEPSPKTPSSARPSTSSSKQVQFRLPPAAFGLGNPGGLTNEQLEDLQEIWIGLKNLLSRIAFGPERVSQAGEHGVYDDKPPQMDEEECLEEWSHYVLGLGLSVISDLAAKEPNPEATVFETAQHMGWTDWSVLKSGASRRTFLDEAVKRASLNLIAEAEKSVSPVQRANTEAQKKDRRSRGQSLANELKQAKRNANLKNVPYSQERPMSLWLHFQEQDGAQLPELVEDAISPSSALPRATIDFGSDSLPQFEGLATSPDVLTPPLYRSPPVHQHQTGGTFSLFPPQTSPQHPALASPPTSSAYSPTGFGNQAASSSLSSTSTSGGRSSSSTGASSFTSRGGSPVHERNSGSHGVHPAFRNAAAVRESVDEYNGLPSAAPVQENSVDCFVFRIVEMGFTAEDARHALRKTDDGKCLSVDRAVEWLLSTGFAA